MSSASPGPPPSSAGEITRLLGRLGEDDSAASKLFDRLYPELHRIARARMRNQPAGLTLETTGLLHEAYIRLIGGASKEWGGRKAFFAHAAKVMRSVLIDHARRRATDKRDAGRRATLTTAALPAEALSIDLVSLDVALEELAAIDPERAQVVELVAFGGLTLEEVAEVLGLSHTTVRRRWRVMRGWLREQLETGDAESRER